MFTKTAGCTWLIIQNIEATFFPLSQIDVCIYADSAQSKGLHENILP